MIPQSRSSALANKARQFNRFAEGMKLSPKERYWRWASFADESDSNNLLRADSQARISEQHYRESKSEILKDISSAGDINEVLR
jgi:asparagine synthase (glutamine-hydrolysing)